MAYTSKWQEIIDDLAKTPDTEVLVAQNVSPSAATRLRQLGATVRAVAITPRGSKSTARYDLYAKVESLATTQEHLNRDLTRNERIIASYEREMNELAAALEENAKERTRLLKKQRDAQYMKTNLLAAQDVMKARERILESGDQDD